MIGISIFTGLLIISLSLILIRKEFIRASKYGRSNFSMLSDGNVDEVLSYLETLEKTVEEMNLSFYEIANDLEGKYSVHDKEIEIIDKKVNEMSDLSNELSTLIKLQGKELGKIKLKSIKAKKDEEILNTKEVEELPYIKEVKSEVMIEKYNKVTNSELKDNVLKLKALGMDESKIAKELNRGVREIRMLLDLIK